MSSQPTSPGLYEQLLIVSFLLFIKSLNLLAEAGNRVALDSNVFKNGKMHTGLAQVIEAIETCGSGLERLPAPPLGAEEADRRFREFGVEVRGFAAAWKHFSLTPQGADRDRAALEFQQRALKIKAIFREAIGLFEQAYPGRLDRALGQSSGTLVI